MYKMNKGPWGSRAWFRAKGDALRRLVETHDPTCQEFQEILPQFGPLNGFPSYDDPATWDPLWRIFTELRSYHEAGPTLKLMRWMSIKEMVEWCRLLIP